jgi:hypothetical protein
MGGHRGFGGIFKVIQNPLIISDATQTRHNTLRIK